MGNILKKYEEHYSGTIVYSYDKTCDENVDFDSFELIKSTETKDRIWVKYIEKWRTNAELIRYLENLIKIIKEEL